MVFAFDGTGRQEKIGLEKEQELFEKKNKTIKSIEIKIKNKKEVKSWENIKKYINYDNSHKNLQGELLNIIESNPQQKHPSPPEIIPPKNNSIISSLNI